jgi:hypothetical protein
VSTKGAVVKAGALSLMICWRCHGRICQAAEGREMLLLPDDPERQLGPPHEVRRDEVGLLGARNHEQFVEEPRRCEVL